MSPHRRIPNVIDIFNGYLKVTDTHLQEVIDPEPPVFYNWKRLGLSQESADEWHHRRLYWENELYPQYIDVNRKTKTVNQNVKNFMKEFIAFGSPLLNIMASGYAVTPTDAAVFRFKIGRKKPSRMVAPISDYCQPLLRSLGGGRIKLGCRYSQVGRPALAEGANSVMIAFKTGDPAPQNPNECPHTIIISRSTTVYDVGVQHIASRFHLFARWYNTKHPQLAGTWSSRTSVVLGE